MTSPPEHPGDDRRFERRFIFASVAVVILLVILLGLGLKYSLDARNKICPPGNPNCNATPPTAPPALLPGQTPPR